MKQQRSDIAKDFDAVLDKRMAPLNEKLAVLTATMELLKPDPSRRIPEVMKENLHGDLGLGFRTVGALAEKAAQRKINTSPEQLASINDEIGNLRSKLSDPAIIAASWSATTLCLTIALL